jgi:ligand-binding sensor domain-containing protein
VNIRRFTGFILANLLGLVLSVHAQIGNNWHVEYFDGDKGLSGPESYWLLQDKLGYLWIATADGLNRFDGYGFKTFRKVPGDTNSIGSSQVSRMVIDQKGNLWVGYSTGGISYYDALKGSFKNYMPLKSVGTSLPPESVSLLYIDRKNNLWIGVRRHGLIRFDIQKNSFIHYSPLPDIHPSYSKEVQQVYNTVYDIYEDESGLFWLATHNGLYTFNPSNGIYAPVRQGPVVPHSFRNDLFRCIVQGKDNTLWMAGWAGGLTSYNTRTREWKNFKFNHQRSAPETRNIIVDIEWKNDNELWIASHDRGIGIFDTKQSEFRFLESSSLLRENLPLINCYNILVDKEKNTWVAHERGLSHISIGSNIFPFTSLPVKHSDNALFFGVTAVIEDTLRHKLIFGTEYADGLNILDKKTGALKNIRFETAKGEEKLLLVNDVLRDSKGTIWVATRDYIYHYDPAKQTLVKPVQPPFDSSSNRSDYYYRIFEDSRGNIWITTVRNGVYRYDAQQRFTHYRHHQNDLNSLCSNTIIEVAEDKRGHLWFASSRSGVSIFDPSNSTFTNLKHSDRDLHSLGSDKITSIICDAKGFVWIATDGGGLSRINANETNPKRFEVYTVEDGLPSDIVLNIMDDASGNIWIASALALSVLNPSTNSISSFTDRDGLRDDYKAYRLIKGYNGKMFIGSFAGYYEFNPATVLPKETKYNLVVNSFKVFDKDCTFLDEIKQKGAINLMPDENFFSFEFAALNLTAPEKFKYAYKLEGFDKDWIYCGTRRYASYTNLPGGEYVFKVKAAYGGCATCENWEGQELAIPLHIESPYWKKSWFIALIAALASVLVYLIYRLRFRQVQEQEKLKKVYNEKIADIEMKALRAQMNPHFIFNCLNSINRYIVKSDHAKASLYLTRFSKLIRLILDNSNSKHILLSHELEALRLYIEMEALRFDNRFSYTITVADDTHSDMIEVPPLIIQPYVENAIWHGLLHKESDGHLSVSIRQVNDHILECVIEDNGVGRDRAREFKSKSATTKKSLGMKLTQDRINILNQYASIDASVQIIDLVDDRSLPTGTRVIVKIPIEG